MKTIPLRLDLGLQEMLREGVRRTQHKEQDLIRITLRLHLKRVIEQEARVKSLPRITNVEPWPKRVVEAAYRRMGNDWDAMENAVVHSP